MERGLKGVILSCCLACVCVSTRILRGFREIASFSTVASGGKLFSTRLTTFLSAPLIEKHPQPLCTWLAKLEIEFDGSLDGLFLKDLGQALRNPREESYLFNHFKT